VMVYPVKRDILKIVKARAELRPLEVRWLNERGGAESLLSWPTLLVIMRPRKD